MPSQPTLEGDNFALVAQRKQVVHNQKARE